MKVLINQPQPVKNRERAQRGFEELLGAAGKRLAGRKPEQRAKQDAQGIEKGADHVRIVARLRGKRNDVAATLLAARTTQRTA